MKPNHKTAWNVVLAALDVEIDKRYDIEEVLDTGNRKTDIQVLISKNGEEIWLTSFYYDTFYEGESIPLQDFLNGKLKFVEAENA